MISAVHGFCIGGGIGISGASDIVICSEDATFVLPEIDRGALGAAIWFQGMKIAEKKTGKVKYEDHVKDPRTQETIDRFLKASDFKFECAEIVGRTFEGVHDHAEHVRGDGCAELIEVLAEAVRG